MALEIHMIGLIAQDMEKYLEFYQRLGLAIPAGSAGQTHVEVKMKNKLTFFLNAPGRVEIADSPHVVLEFYLKERPAPAAERPASGVSR
jgi:hypothetical protein